MKKILLSLAGLVLASVAPSFAATVQFNTSTSELCFGASGCGVQFQVVGGLTVTYVPTTSGILNANPLASSNFGEIHLQCNDGTTSCGQENLSGLQLYLVFTQLLPEAGTGQISTNSIVGSIGGNSGFAQIIWTSPSTTITGTSSSIKYTVANSPLNLVSPSSSSSLPVSTLGPPGITTIQGIVEDTAIPEPSTYAMLGTALLGLGYLRRRK